MVSPEKVSRSTPLDEQVSKSTPGSTPIEQQEERLVVSENNSNYDIHSPCYIFLYGSLTSLSRTRTTQCTVVAIY